MRIVVLLLFAASCGFGDNLAARTCGDHHLDPGEGCDDGNTVGGDGCSETCELESVCGNGVREVGEACDDGNTTSGDGCSATCTVESAACTLVPQSGCSGATPACDLTAADDGTTECRAVTVNGSFDSLCHSDPECGVGFTCVTSGAIAWCQKMCTADAECGTGPTKCALDLVNAHGDPLGVKTCSNKCFILTQTGCPTGTGCIGVESSTGDFTDCRVMGTKLDGDACTRTTDCLPGSACVSSGGAAACHAYCDVNDPNACNAGELCTAFTPSLVIGNTTLGFCE